MASGLTKLSNDDREYIKRSQIITEDQFVYLLERLEDNAPIQTASTTTMTSSTPLWLYEPPGRLTNVSVCKVIAPTLTPLSANFFARKYSTAIPDDSPYHHFQQILP